MRTGRIGDATARASRVLDGLRVGLLLLVLWLPILQMNLHFVPPADIAERRRLHPAPAFDARHLVRTAWQYESFFKDRFGLRDLLVRWDAIVRLEALHASPVSRLIRGRDGWIFYDSEKAGDGVTIRDYRGLAAYTPAELRRIRENLAARGRWCRARGIRCYLVVVPNKETVYSDYLPPELRRLGPRTRLDQVCAAVGPDCGVTLVDLRPALRAARRQCPEPIYFRGGTHWNSYGAYYGYREIVRVLARSFPALRAHELDEFEITVVPKSAEDEWLHLGEGVSYRFRLLPATARPPGRGMPAKIVVVQDSFWENLEPFLSPHFPRVLCVHWALKGDPSLPLLERERPACVLYEVAERYADLFWNP